jgi:nucleoside-diphosphate kinase
MERTLILVKPDAYARRLSGEILARFERKGLVPVALRVMTMTRELAERHYAEHVGSPSSASSSTSSPPGRWSRWCSRAPSAIAAARQVIGATNPLEAAPGSIRGDLAIETGAEPRPRLGRAAGPPRARSGSSSRRHNEWVPGNLVLASRSPQRRAILERLGVGVRCSRPSDAAGARAGRPAGGRAARTRCARRSRCRSPPASSFSAWTPIVALDGVIHGKPRDEAGGGAHDAARSPARRTSCSVPSCPARAGRRARNATPPSTSVTFRELDDAI